MSGNAILSFHSLAAWALDLAIRRLRFCRLGIVVLLFLLPCLGIRADTEVAPKIPSPQELEESIQKGVQFLLKTQLKSGCWGSARNTKDLNIYAPIPGAHDAFRSGVTAMAVLALIETGAADANPEAKASLEKGEAWLLENLPNLRRANSTAIYNVWGHAYGIQALAKMHGRSRMTAQKREQIIKAIEQQIQLLRNYESVDGGWGYYDFDVGAKRPASSSTSFVTATVLVAFHEARLIGVDIPEDLIKRAKTSLLRQQKSDFSYLYAQTFIFRPMAGINRPGGSLGRSQACNIALRYWGETNITDEVLNTWLDRLVTRNGWLSIGRKRPVPHEAWFQVAGYFFYYGHYYAARCIEALPAEQRGPHQDQLAAIITSLQEKDGSWWDFPFYDYHQPYGTSFALMTLARCRQQSP